MAAPDRRNARPTSTILRSTDMHRAHHAEIDREEHADRDQRDLRGLENAEPQHEQRHPGDRRNRAQRLQGRIEQPPQQRGIAGDRAEQRAGHRRRCRSRPRRAAASRATWRCNSPVCASSANVAIDHAMAAAPAGRRTSPARTDDFPDHRQADRQQQAEQRPRPARQAVAAGLALFRRGRVRRRCVMGTKRHTNTRCKARLTCRSHRAAADRMLAPWLAACAGRASDDSVASVRQRHAWSSISSSTVAFTSTSALMTPACCNARPACRIESRCSARRSCCGSARCAP